MMDFDGDRELAKARFLKSVALAAEVLPAWELNFFAGRILFQMDPKDELGLQAALTASLEAERQEGAAGAHHESGKDALGLSEELKALLKALLEAERPREG